MKLEEMYAQALWAADTKDSAKAFETLKRTLKARGHEKLMPKIASEYQKLEVRAQRLALHKKVTPERERTRVLLELYHKLVAAH